MADSQPISQDDGGRPISRQCAGHVKLPDGTLRRCRRSADHGTNVCGSHGARAPQVKAAAARRVAQGEVMRVYERFSVNEHGGPVDVLIELADLVREVRQFRDFLRNRVSELSADQWSYEHPARERITAEIALYERACDRSARLLADVARLGLEDLERRAAGQQALLEQARAERIVAGFDDVLSMLDLDERQRELAPRAMAAFLLWLAGEATDA